MTIRVGINGFGRIGRMAFRAIYQEFDGDIEVVGINDLLGSEYLAYMLKYDSVHGQFKGDIKTDNGNLIVNGKTIRLTAERDPADLAWGDIDVDLVLECTGFFLTEEGCQKHIDAGAKKVVMSAPSKDGTPMFVYGVNHDTYAGQAVVSAASCTTNCLAPVAKVLKRQMGCETWPNDHRSRCNCHSENRRRPIRKRLAWRSWHTREHHPFFNRCGKSGRCSSS